MVCELCGSVQTEGEQRKGGKDEAEEGQSTYRRHKCISEIRKVVSVE